MAVHPVLPGRAAGDREPAQRQFLRRGQRFRPGRRRGDRRHHLGAQYRARLLHGRGTGALLPACQKLAPVLGAAGLCRDDRADRALQPRRRALSRDADRQPGCALLPGHAADDGEPLRDLRHQVGRAGYHRLPRRPRVIPPSAPIRATPPPTSAGASAGTRSKRSGAGSMPSSCRSWGRSAPRSTASARIAATSSASCKA